MKTLNQKLVLFSLVASTAALMGCGAQEDENPTIIVRNPNKKITKPVRCSDSDKMNISATWNTDEHAFGYSISFGFMRQPPIDKMDVDADVQSYSYADGQRGRSYTLNVVRQSRNGQNDYRNISITIPKCADLAEYKKAHPEYREPLDFVIVF